MKVTALKSGNALSAGWGHRIYGVGLVVTGLGNMSSVFLVVEPGKIIFLI